LWGLGKETAETNQKKHDSNEKYSNTDIRLLVIPQEYPIPILPYLSWVKSHEITLENKLISAGRYRAKPKAPLERGWMETWARRDGQEPGYNEGIKAPPSRRDR
jgi:hypothetical protein